MPSRCFIPCSTGRICRHRGGRGPTRASTSGIRPRLCLPSVARTRRFSMPVRPGQRPASRSAPRHGRGRTRGCRCSSRGRLRCRPSGRRRRSSIAIVVVLPAPFGPMNPATTPVGTSRLRLSTATRPPYRLVRPWVTSAGRCRSAEPSVGSGLAALRLGCVHTARVGRRSCAPKRSRGRNLTSSSGGRRIPPGGDSVRPPLATRFGVGAQPSSRPTNLWWQKRERSRSTWLSALPCSAASWRSLPRGDSGADTHELDVLGVVLAAASFHSSPGAGHRSRSSS